MRMTNWTQTAIACWIVLSVYPVFLYFFPPSIPQTICPILSKQDTPHQEHPSAYDAFWDYNTADSCRFSSLDLHKPTLPLCDEKDKDGLLRAISGGGRIGNDAPYQTRGCDMRWFTTEEICSILSRFHKIFVVGDSLMRDLDIAFFIFLRKDLVDGGRLSWSEDPEGVDCGCEAPWEDRRCAYHIVINSDQVYDHAPHLMACSAETTAFFKYHTATAWPLTDDHIQGVVEAVPKEKPAKPIAYIYGAGLWNDLVHNETTNWIDQMTNATSEAAPWLFEPGQMNPRLFLTPNAAHAAKNPKHWAKQGNIPLSMFEVFMGAYVKDVHDIDHLGTFNMSIQATSWDGTHGGMRVNLLKAMAVINWLNALDVSKW